MGHKKGGTLKARDSAHTTRTPQRIARHLKGDGTLVLLDLGVVFVSYLVALVIRFDGSVPKEFWNRLWMFELLAAGLHLAANYAFGLYGRMWRYASIHEARHLAASGTMVAAVVVLISIALGHDRLVPISVGLVGATLSLIGFGAIRFQSRLFGLRRRTENLKHTRVLVVGAGDAGAAVLKDILQNPSLSFVPVAVVDDDRRKRGRRLHGIEVLGDRDAIPSLVEELDVDQVLFAIPSATSEVVRNVASLCEKAGVMLRVLPTVHEVIGGKVSARDIRDLQIEDLLGRQQVEIDMEEVQSILKGRRVLVTGAGGSIGSEIARQVAAFEPAALMLLDHDETHLHDIATDLPEAEEILLDIRDRARVDRALSAGRPEVVFHAAAHKHVPLLEKHPEEALMTNVVGTINVCESAIANGTERFILISTDKAVMPVSAMGASKRLAEHIVRTTPQDGRVTCTVRFGNVLGSRGSVIPTFLRQIHNGGPVTVTHPDMTRYFMSVQEAVLLVLQAAALARGGEVFTLDMGEPVNILDLARKVIRLSGRVPDSEIKVAIMGPRPGEKLNEDTVDPQEKIIGSPHPSIVTSCPDRLDRDLLIMGIRELERLAIEGLGSELDGRMKELAGKGSLAGPANEADTISSSSQ